MDQIVFEGGRFLSLNFTGILGDLSHVVHVTLMVCQWCRAQRCMCHTHTPLWPEAWNRATL